MTEWTDETRERLERACLLVKWTDSGAQVDPADIRAALARESDLADQVDYWMGKELEIEKRVEELEHRPEKGVACFCAECWQRRCIAAQDALVVREAKLAEAEEQLRDERRFCLCGCPVEHHSATEDGLECDEHPDFECVLVCAPAKVLWDRLEAEVERLRDDAILLESLQKATERERDGARAEVDRLEGLIIAQLGFAIWGEDLEREARRIRAQREEGTPK